MPRNCSLQLDVYFPFSLTEEYDEDAVAWSVSTDPDHPYPFLLGPRQYATQEIDPIACTASIGQVEIGVTDEPTVPGDQDTGWMTSRVHDVTGRRCLLRRYVDSTIGWVVIADGPAGPPKMDTSYSAYRWTIRDTRETERRTTAFGAGGVASIVPRGSIYDWGRYEDGEGEHFLLPSTLSDPIVGTMIAVGGVGYISAPTHAFPPIADDVRIVVNEAAEAAMATSKVGENAFAAEHADVLWRKVGNVAWNVSRMRSTVAMYYTAFQFEDGKLNVDDEKFIRLLSLAMLFVEPSGVPPAGFPAHGDSVEFVVRYRGAASKEFPYYVEGELGDVITKMYTHGYSSTNNSGIAGIVYDPADLDARESEESAAIRFDPDAFTPLTEHVLLRETAPVEDVRAYAEARLYSPSGWIAALDNQASISPVNRGRPEIIDPYSEITNGEVVPNPGWNTGINIVSAIEYNYHRYFKPASDAGFEVAPDGLAIRPVEVKYKDEESRLRYGDNIETFDATAFSAVGTDEGLNLPGVTEQADLLAQIARFDVLERFREGVQGISLLVKRIYIPLLRVGDWIPWNLSWLPSRTTGLRGSQVDAAQITAIRDDNCVWRTVTLEESAALGATGGDPGYASDLSIDTDDFEPGYASDLTEVSDTDEGGGEDSEPPEETAEWLTVSVDIPPMEGYDVTAHLRLTDDLPVGWTAEIYISERISVGTNPDPGGDPYTGGDRASEFSPSAAAPGATLSTHIFTSENIHHNSWISLTNWFEMIAELYDDTHTLVDSRTITTSWSTG